MLLVIIGAAMIIGGTIIAAAIGSRILSSFAFAFTAYAPFIAIPLGVFFILLGLTQSGRISWRMKRAKIE